MQNDNLMNILFNNNNNNNYSLLIPHTNNSIIPKFIKFNLNEAVDINDFIEQIKDATISLRIGGTLLSEQTFGLYTKLNQPIQNNNNILVKIPFDLFMSCINLSFYHSLKFCYCYFY